MKVILFLAAAYKYPKFSAAILAGYFALRLWQF